MASPERRAEVDPETTARLGRDTIAKRPLEEVRSARRDNDEVSEGMARAPVDAPPISASSIWAKLLDAEQKSR
jgi:hypothetical protein